VTNNPYTPPAAVVADPERVRGPRPRSVSIAVVLIWIAIGAMLAMLGSVVWQTSFDFFVARPGFIGAGIGMVIWSFLSYQIARGRNWARLLFTALCLYDSRTVWSGVNRMIFQAVANRLELVCFYLRPVAGMIAIILLFGPGRAWFRKAQDLRQ